MYVLTLSMAATFFAGSMQIPLETAVRLKPLYYETLKECVEARDYVHSILVPIPEDIAKREQMGVSGELVGECRLYVGW